MHSHVLSPLPILLVDDGKVSVARRRSHHRCGGSARAVLPVADALVVTFGGAQDDRHVRVAPGQLGEDHGLGLERGKLGGIPCKPDMLPLLP